MEIREATTADELRACFPVVRQLRPHLDEAGFVEQVERQRSDGYRLVYVERDGEPVAVAGFRVLEMLSRGRAGRLGRSARQGASGASPHARLGRLSQQAQMERLSGRKRCESVPGSEAAA